MNDFTFYSPTKIVFGRDAIDRTGEELAALGFTRALIVYGGGSVLRTGTLDRVKASLDARGIAYAELGGVRPNPEITSVREGIELARAERVDVVLPVGGGSAMDAAKPIALGACYDGDAWDFFAKRATPAQRIPVVAVPTIPASGSEASNSAVISNDAEHLKSGLNTDLNRPVLAIMDPTLTFTLPPYQTAAGVTDMIAHIMERFFSGEPAAPVTDNIACGIIRAVMDAAPRVLENPEDYDARANIMWAGTLAHNGLAGCGTNVPGGRDESPSRPGARAFSARHLDHARRRPRGRVPSLDALRVAQAPRALPRFREGRVRHRSDRRHRGGGARRRHRDHRRAARVLRIARHAAHARRTRC